MGDCFHGNDIDGANPTMADSTPFILPTLTNSSTQTDKPSAAEKSARIYDMGVLA